MAKPNLAVSTVEFDIDAIAAALKITPVQAIDALRDGRGAWPFSELWGASLYEFIKHGNTNKPVSDGAIALDQLRDVNVSIKALTRRGIKFQQSKFVGFGRSTDQQGLGLRLKDATGSWSSILRHFPWCDSYRLTQRG